MGALTRPPRRQPPCTPGKQEAPQPVLPPARWCRRCGFRDTSWTASGGAVEDALDHRIGAHFAVEAAFERHAARIRRGGGAAGAEDAVEASTDVAARCIEFHPVPVD